MIDAHVHFWRVARGDNLGLNPSSSLWRDHEPTELAPQLAAARVDQIIVVAAAETHAENLYTMGLALAHPEMIAGVVPWIDLASPAIAEEIATLRATGRLLGLRPVQAGNASIAWMLEPRNERGYRAMAEGGLPLEILIENPDQMPVAIAVARQHSQLTVVLDHCGKPDILHNRFDPWATDLAAFAALPNTFCKFSGLLARAAPGSTADDIGRYARHVLSAFGPSRLMWASDWPPLTRNSDYATWAQVSTELLAGLTPPERADIQAGTARRIYRLQERQR